MSAHAADVLAELIRSHRRQSFSAEAAADGHIEQLKAVTDSELYQVWLCSRRAAKTYGLAILSLVTALSRPRRNLLYVGLSKPHARKFLWEEVWKPLIGKWGIRCRIIEDEMTTYFPNGSVLYVSGTDDIRHVQSFLGNRLDLAIVDEAQSQSDSVLVPLTTTILPNALLDDAEHPGKLIMSGTIPDVDAGQFMKVWKENTWSRHNWNRFQNPHLKNQHAMLAAYLKANPGLTVDSPTVQREWFGKFVFDNTKTAYTYSQELNGYDGDPPDWLDTFSVGIDPGTRDRTAIIVWGWSHRSRDVYQVAEWVTERHAKTTWAQIGEQCGRLEAAYHPAHWYYDAGGSQMTLDTFTVDYGVPVVKAANKSDLPGQVARMNDLLTQGRLKVIKGSKLEEDLQKARWDQDARAKGLYRWSALWHPDPADAGRYGLQGYFDEYAPPPTEIPEQVRIRQAHMAAMAKPQRDKDAARLGFGARGDEGDDDEWA